MQNGDLVARVGPRRWPQQVTSSEQPESGGECEDEEESAAHEADDALGEVLGDEGAT
jgi:hypothetical protein